MVLFMLIAGAILVYGAAYGVFLTKKGGIAAALPIWCLLSIDVGLLILLLWFRTRT